MGVFLLFSQKMFHFYHRSSPVVIVEFISISLQFSIYHNAHWHRQHLITVVLLVLFFCQWCLSFNINDLEAKYSVVLPAMAETWLTIPITFSDVFCSFSYFVSYSFLRSLNYNSPKEKEKKCFVESNGILKFRRRCDEYKPLRSLYTERKRKRKRTFSLIFVAYCFVFLQCSLIFFAFTATVI